MKAMKNESTSNQQKATLLTITFICIIVVLATTGCNRWYVDYGIGRNQLKSKEILPNLILALDDPEPRTRVSALRFITLLKYEAQDAIPKVVELAKNDTGKNVKYYAINTLRMIVPCNQEGLDLMQEVISANSGEMATLAESALETIEGNEYITLEESLSLLHPCDGIELKITQVHKFFNGYRTIYPSRLHMLPFEIMISNQSDYSVSLSAESFKLSGPNGKILPQVTPADAIKKQYYSIGKTFLFGFPVASQIKAGRANGIISKYCEEKVLTELILAPGQDTTKILFFNCPKLQEQFSGWQLAFSLTQKDCGQKTNIHYTFGSGAEITTEQITPRPLLTRRQPPPITLENKLLELESLKEKKLITEEEYTEKRELLIKEF